MRIENDPKLDFDDVLIRPKRSTLVSRQDVDISRTLKMKHGAVSWTGVPIIAANMDTIGTFNMARKLSEFNMMTALDKHYSIDEYVEFFRESINIRENVFYTLGLSEKDLEKFNSVKKQLGSTSIKNLCVDVANGYTEAFTDFVKKIRDQNSDVRLMAGNVVTAEMTEELILSGADIGKVGIGPGSVCTTRKMTGVGYPQLSAIIECADAAHGLGGLICADGGIKVPGDLGKAFGAGSDFVMCGGLFAGHDECNGEITNTEANIKPGYNFSSGKIIDIATNKTVAEIFEDDTSFYYDIVPTKDSTMIFYGMSSDTAMEIHSGGVAEYRASEGKTVEVPYRGPVEGTVKEVLGGLRSTCTYVGAKHLKELSKRTTFIMVNRQLNNKFGE